MAGPIYLDHQATTPCDPRVVAAMVPWFSERFGNPHSAEHRYGWAAAEAVDRARAQVAALIGARPQDVIFTAGATEANNIALLGVLGGRPPARIAVSAVEHDSVMEPARGLAAAGHRLTILPVTASGAVDWERAAEPIAAGCALVSIQLANHETGVVQTEIARAAAIGPGVVHCDAAQAAGRIPVDVAALGCALLTISAHKLYGPKGIGALWIRPGLRLAPVYRGGGQERGLRPGTLPVPLCVGFGEAAAIAMAGMAAEARRLEQLRDRLAARLGARLPRSAVNGAGADRLPGSLSVTLPGIDALALLTALAGDLALSTGSACASGSARPSPVLRAMGLDDAAIHGTIRIGLGRWTTQAEVDCAADLLAAAADRQRAG